MALGLKRSAMKRSRSRPAPTGMTAPVMGEAGPSVVVGGSVSFSPLSGAQRGSGRPPSPVAGRRLRRRRPPLSLQQFWLLFFF